MASYNKIILAGNLGQDPETRYMPSGDAVTTLSVATSERWKDKASGEQKERTEWWKCTAFGRTAEIADEYLKKGSQVLIEGRGRTETWEKDGQKHYRFTVAIDNLVMLGSRQGGDAPAERQAKAEGKPAAKKPAGSFNDMEDDIPFASCELGDDVIFRKLRWGHE
jgi:single-strand DNA-binding protein